VTENFYGSPNMQHIYIRGAWWKSLLN
jgi:hypothetical protein